MKTFSDGSGWVCPTSDSYYTCSECGTPNNVTKTCINPSCSSSIKKEKVRGNRNYLVNLVEQIQHVVPGGVAQGYGGGVVNLSLQSTICSVGYMPCMGILVLAKRKDYNHILCGLFHYSPNMYGGQIMNNDTPYIFNVLKKNTYQQKVFFIGRQGDPRFTRDVGPTNIIKQKLLDSPAQVFDNFLDPPHKNSTEIQCTNQEITITTKGVPTNIGGAHKSQGRVTSWNDLMTIPQQTGLKFGPKIIRIPTQDLLNSNATINPTWENYWV